MHHGRHASKRTNSGKRSVADLAGGFVIGAVLLTVTTGFAATSSTTLRAGNSLNVTCRNALSNTNVAADSETVNCAANTPPPTSTTSTTSTTTTTSTEYDNDHYRLVVISCLCAGRRHWHLYREHDQP